MGVPRVLGNGHSPARWVRPRGRRGIGSALLRPTLDRADAAGLAAYIEASSERSAALHERLGFVHTQVLALPEGGPSLWLMRRPPERSARSLP